MFVATPQKFQVGKSKTGLLGGNSDCDPPDPISNSEVKPVSVDDSVGLAHAKVEHPRAFFSNPLLIR